MAASATVLQALHITLSSIHVSGASRAASSRSCAALRPPPLAHTLSQQPVRHGRSQRRPAAYQVVEAAQADKPRGRNPAVNLSGGGSSGGNPAWQPLVAALDRRQPEAAWKEFMRLLEQGILPPIAVCDRLIYGAPLPAPPRCAAAGGGFTAGSSRSTSRGFVIGATAIRRQPRHCQPRAHAASPAHCSHQRLAVPCPRAMPPAPAALCGRRRFQEAWRAYAATTPAGYSLQYNTYQALITLALKVCGAGGWGMHSWSAAGGQAGALQADDGRWRQAAAPSPPAPRLSTVTSPPHPTSRPATWMRRWMRSATCRRAGGRPTLSPTAA